MNAAGWWITGIVGGLAVITALGIFVGKVLRRVSRQYDAVIADFDRERRVEDPTEQWCCYQGSGPDDAVWRVTEMGDTGRNLIVLRARNIEGAKVAHRTVGFGSWQEFPVARTSDAEGGAA